MHPLPEIGIGQADDHAALNAGETVDRRLDLGRIDVGAARDDHVHAPVGEVQPAVLVDIAHVAQGLERPVRPRLGAEVSVGRPLPPQRHEIDLAHLARRARLAGLVQHLHLVAGQDLADRARVIQPLDPANARAAHGLGARVDFPDRFRPDPLDPFLLQPRRAGGGDMHDGVQRRHVVFRLHLVGQGPDPVHHGRHLEQPADLVPVYKPQSLLRVKARHQNDVHPPAHGQTGHAERRGVIQRPRVQQHVVRDHAEQQDVGIGHGRRHVDDHLGPSRRAAAGDGLQVFRRDFRQGRGIGGGVPGLRLRQPFRRPRLRGIVDDDQARLEKFQNPRQLRRRQLVRQRRRGRAQRPDRERQLQKRRAVGQGDGDEIPLDHPRLLQGPRPAIDPLRQFAPRQGHALEGQGRAIRIALRMDIQQHADRPHPGQVRHRCRQGAGAVGTTHQGLRQAGFGPSAAAARFGGHGIRGLVRAM